MSVLKTFDIALDTKKALYGSRITLVESDTGNRFVITLTDDGTAVDLTGCRVSVVFSGAMGTAMQESWTGTGDVSISGTSNNIITIDVHSGSFATGLNTCEIQVYSGATYTTLITSARFTFNAQKPILDDETIVSTDSYPTLVYWADKLEALTEREQADWTEADNTKGTYIQNKPVAGTNFQDATQNLTAETAVADTDTVPFYDLSETAHRKSTWANIKSLIRTAFFGSSTGILKADGSGTISVAAENTDYAAATHASRHAAGAADAITPGDIRAAALVHKARHATGGADVLAPSDIGAAGLDAYGKVLASQASARVVTITDANPVLIQEHAGCYIQIGGSVNKTVTIPSHASVPYPIGTEIELVDWLWGGRMTLALGAGVSIYWTDGTTGGVTSPNVGATYVIKKVGQDVWTGGGK